MEGYQILGRIGEGAHGLVLKAKRKSDGTTVALKKLPLKRIEDGMPINLLREIKALQFIESDYVVRLLDVFPQGMTFVLVFEFLPYDLSHLLRDSSVDLRVDQVKKYMEMLLKGMAYCHGLGIMHRDIKPANLLISEEGVLKIADFGLCRLVHQGPGGGSESASSSGSGAHEGNVPRPLSHQVATRWYRAPELLYGSRTYDVGVDLWAIGCVFGEMLNKSPLFPGENDIDQLRLVLHSLGTPTNESWPGMNDLPDYNKISFPPAKGIPYEDICPDAEEEAIDLLKSFLVYDSKRRISAADALEHVYFRTWPLPCQMDQMPKLSRDDLSRNSERLESGWKLGVGGSLDIRPGTTVAQNLTSLWQLQAEIHESQALGESEELVW